MSSSVRTVSYGAGLQPTDTLAAAHQTHSVQAHNRIISLASYPVVLEV